MPLTQEQKDLISQDFIDIFQAKYGDNWRHMLTKKLQPSPIPMIAHTRGATISEVKKIRAQFIAVGRILTFMETLTEPIQHSTPLILDLSP